MCNALSLLLSLQSDSFSLIPASEFVHDKFSFENTYDLFIEIMRSERIYCLSSFIVSVWGKRRDFIYNSDS